MKKKITLDNIADFPSCEACKAGPFGKDDYPVKITCYRETEEWKSVKAATVFFYAGMAACGGSEGERYARIYFSLQEGKREVTDEEDYSQILSVSNEREIA